MEPLENNTNEPHITDVPPEPQASSSIWSGLVTRVVSSVILIAAFVGALVFGGWLFTWLIMIAALMMMREWNNLTELEGSLWRFAGLFYVSIPCASLIWLRSVETAAHPDAGVRLILFLMLAVWATDIGAYFSGRKIGGPKLAPVISPAKTWAGLAGGAVAAGIVSGFSQIFSPYPDTPIKAVAAGVIIAVISQMGDLFESWLKRRAGVKDSGTLIPGHGGLLDRVDGLVPTLPLYAALVALAGLSG